MSPLLDVLSHRNSDTTKYPTSVFDEEAADPVELIEVRSDGIGSRRLEVTEDLLSTYIEQDYGVSLFDDYMYPESTTYSSNQTSATTDTSSLPSQETIKLL
jgi:hypothetical protein